MDERYARRIGFRIGQESNDESLSPEQREGYHSAVMDMIGEIEKHFPKFAPLFLKGYEEGQGV